MIRTFDLVVIGTGTAALSIAYPCREAGWKVAVVDSRPYGGTCANRGCDPKKVLVGGAEAIDWARRMQGSGISFDSLRIDWAALMKFKRGFTDPVPAAREEALERAGIERCHGLAHFVNETTIDVGGEQLQARYIGVAAGAGPARLGISGEDLMLTSDDFLELPALPKKLAFVGGGYIAFEFAHIAVRAGAEVSILHRGARPLEQFEPELVAQLVKHSRELGIDIRLGAAVKRIDKREGGFRVTASADDGEIEISADAVVHGAGRPPLTEGLKLDSGNVSCTKRGITVNEFLQSVSNPHVYAAGDVAASGAPLTPVAGYDGRIVAHNLLNGNQQRTDYRGCASTAFTLPPLSAVGLSERDAREQGLEIDVHKGETAGWYSSRRINERCSGYKMLVEKGTNRILGAHLLGQGSEEMINVFALAIRAGLTSKQVKETLFAYPTHGSDIQYML